MNRNQIPWESEKISAREVRGLLLVSVGVGTLVLYLSWWFKLDRLLVPPLLLVFAFVFPYALFQVFGSWLIYLATFRRVRRLLLCRPTDLTIDVFVTACGESERLVERSLQACLKMNGGFNLWLLDDGDDPRLRELARRLGVSYLTRRGNADRKAGNINAALTRTHGEIVIIFDVDHAPAPSFLSKTIPYFGDPEMGFVQVMLTFDNGQEGWIAKAAAESSLDFYNPTSIGSDGMWSTTLVGSNAVIRRAALQSIGGYRPGLAEDLATSVALHAHGWRSVYVEQPLAPGYAPPDLTAWFTQQLKWSRGVFEVLLTDFARSLPHLKRGMLAAYSVRMTYYWIGLLMGLHVLVAAGVMLAPKHETLYAFQDYLLHAAPLVALVLLIRQRSLQTWRHPTLKASIHWRPVMLILGSWPVYAWAWLLAVARRPLRFRPTPKSRNGACSLAWLLPQLVTAVVLLVGLLHTFLVVGLRYPLVLLFGGGLLLPHLLVIGLGIADRWRVFFNARCSMAPASLTLGDFDGC